VDASDHRFFGVGVDEILMIGANDDEVGPGAGAEGGGADPETVREEC